jgi:Ca-activated chloride channel family protein
MPSRWSPAAATSALLCLALPTCTRTVQRTPVVVVQTTVTPVAQVAPPPAVAVAASVSDPPRVRRDEPAPTPAARVERVALTEETLAARRGVGRRDGHAEPFRAELRPEPLRTPDGRRGWVLNLGAGRPLATPAVVDGTVYVGGGFGSHEFYAFDAVSGETRWALRVSDDGPTAAVVSDGVVAFNTESCTLFVVDAARGRPLWSRWLGDPLMSQPAIGDGKVFMAFPSPQGHRLVAFTLRTGEEQWRVPLAADIISAPVLHGDSVYSATFNGTLYRHRASDGGLAWREDYRATSAPWLYGNEVFVSHREDPVAAPRPRGFMAMSMLTWVLFAQTEAVGRLSGSSGSSMQQGGNGYRARSAPWLNTDVQRRSRYSTENAASDTSVGFSTAPAAARADEAAANIGQGTVRGMWEYQGSRPCVVDGRLFLTQGDQLVAMEPASGRELWSRPLSGLLAEAGGHLASPPSAAGGKLYLGTVTGDVVVVDQADGRVVDTIRLGHATRFQPAVVGGRLYVGTADGRLVMLELNDPTADGWSQWGGGPSHNGR